MLKLEDKEWEVKHSSLAQMSDVPMTYEQCRAFSCEDISRRTMVSFPIGKGDVVEIPEGKEFHFIGRVDTGFYRYDPHYYFHDFDYRNFISFSTISNRNISHYKGLPFFIYNILPEDIVHVFPMDSDTDVTATSEEELTRFPSLWINLKELECLRDKMRTYNQITCKTKRNGQIIKPIAIVSFGELDDDIKVIADRFEVGCVIIHPAKNAINYGKDFLHDFYAIKSCAHDIMKKYDIDLTGAAYLD